MAWVITKHGFAKDCPDNMLDRFIRKQGCRLVDDEDWRYLKDDKTYFECPWVKGFDRQRGSLGDRPILIIGGGPSCNNGDVKNAYSIACNPRYYTRKADAMLAIDPVYWTHGRHGHNLGLTFAQEYPYANEADFYVGAYGPTPVSSAHPKVHRFGFPLFPIKSKETNNKLAVRVGDAVKQVKISGIAAILVARFLSSGPIVLVGFDLKGKHILGEEHPYEKEQLTKWELVSEFFKDVYIHYENPGPLVNVFPTYRGK